MPDKGKKEKSISSLLHNRRGRKSDPPPLNTTGVANDGECMVWPVSQALTLRSLSSEEPDARKQAGDASLCDSRDSLQDPQSSASIRLQEDGTSTVASDT
jgi:hypothetical protein